MENRIKIAVLGGGIVGLISAYSIKDVADVTLISPELGGTWASGGLKILKWHPWLEQMMRQLGVPFFLHSIQGAVWWKKRLIPLNQIDEKIQRAHYKRTRNTMEGFDGKCMNEKAGVEQTIDFKYEHLVKALKAHTNWVKGRVVQIYMDGGTVWLDTTVGKGAFDYVFTTMPLWEMRKVSGFWLPRVKYRKLYVAEMITKNPPPLYHYVYFPKGHGPHRISAANQDRTRWSMEFQSDCEPSAYEWSKLIKPIQKLIPDARLGKLRGSIPGHLLPLSDPLEYPERVVPLGRFASWDSRETVDKVVEKFLRFATGVPVLRWRQL